MSSQQPPYVSPATKLDHPAIGGESNRQKLAGLAIVKENR